MDEKTKVKEMKQCIHVVKSGVCQRENMHVGYSVFLYYPAHIKCSQMHAHTYEYITKNSLESRWPPNRKAKK